MVNVLVTNDNYALFAAKHYSNPSCLTEQEFKRDLERIKFIQKMLRRYQKDGFINERLVLNHLILLYNVFERDAITKILALKLREQLSLLKPFLVLLNYWPEQIIGIEGGDVIGSNIPLDQNLVDKLRRI